LTTLKDGTVYEGDWLNGNPVS